MFYAHLLMSKRGPLAKIWLAAHWDKKLTKAHVFECNLETTIEKILSPKVTIALRTSGHLLLGVVRIYHRKAKYLLADCSEAFLKMKMAFRPGVVDLPGDNLEATYNAITLPEEFHEFEMKLPDINAIDVAEHFALNQSRVEDITLREAYGGDVLHGGSFGDETEIFRHNNILDDSLSMSAASLFAENSSASLAGDREVMDNDREVFKLDGFGDEGVAVDMLDNLLSAEQDTLMEGVMDMSKEIPLPPVPIEEDNNAMESEVLAPPALAENTAMLNETTLLPNEEDGFALEPVNATVPVGKKKNKKKRKLLVDTVKELSSNTMKKQLTDFLDTITNVDIAPPTRKLMSWKEIGGVESLLSRPSQSLIHAKLQTLFTRCLIPHSLNEHNNGEKLEPEREHLRKQDLPEMPMLEEPSCLQESKLSETCKTSVAETPILQVQTEEAHELINAGEMLQPFDTGISDTSLLTSSAEKEKEKHLAESAATLGIYEDAMECEQDNEDRRWNKRTRQILSMLRDINKKGATSFSLLKLCEGHNRKQASATFYSFLVLKKRLALELEQRAPYADIIATPGPRFSTV
ncbi:double-strand-break repair protein rad21-like protein 1 isoform X1 [Lissotriton helveticus]